MKTLDEVRSAIQTLRREILISEVSEADTRVESELPTAIKLMRSLAYLDLASLALEQV